MPGPGRRPRWWPAWCRASPRSASPRRPAPPAGTRRRGRGGPCPAALPPGPAVDQDGAEVVDHDLARPGQHLDPLLASHRRGAAVGDSGHRAVREPQGQRHAVVPAGRVPAQHAGRVLDVGARERLGQVDEVADLAEQAPAVAPVQVPMAAGDPPRGDPVDDQLRRRHLGQGPLGGLHGGAQRRLKPSASWRPEPRQAFSTSSRSSRVSASGFSHHTSRPAARAGGQVGVHVVRGGDHDQADVGVVDDRAGAGDRLLEAVPLGGPPGGDAAGRGDRHETLEARLTEGGQQRPGGELARADPADAGRVPPGRLGSPRRVAAAGPAGPGRPRPGS